MFIAVIASMVQLVEMIVEKFAPALYGAQEFSSLDHDKVLTILGGSLFMQQKDFLESLNLQFTVWVRELVGYWLYWLLQPFEKRLFILMFHHHCVGLALPLL